MTFQSDESAWQRAREEAASALVRNDFAQAEAKYQLALEYAKKLNGSAPDHLFMTYMDLATLYRKQDRLQPALAAFTQAHDQLVAMKAPPDSNELYRRMIRLTKCRSAYSIGEIYHKQHELKKAELMLKEALTIRGYGLGAMGLIEDAKKELCQVLREEGRGQEAASIEHNPSYDSMQDI